MLNEDDYPSYCNDYMIIILYIIYNIFYYMIYLYIYILYSDSDNCESQL